MTSPVTSIRNLGPATAKLFAKCGIHTADEIISLGADEAYSCLLAAGVRPHFIGYYALVMGLQGRSWTDCQGDEKQALREKFDAIKNLSFDVKKNEFETLMDQLGVR